MTTDTAKKIEEYIEKNRQATAKELAGFLEISPQALFKQLLKLQTKGTIYKIGTPPKVFYLRKEKIQTNITPTDEIDKDAEKIIEENYLFITPSGERKEGLQGFKFWCNKTKQPIDKTALEYAKCWQKYDAYKKNGVIDGTFKLKSTFPIIYLNKLYYLDFYSIERFGKTKLGQLLLYAKQSQNVKMIKDLITNIKPTVQLLIKKFQIDAVLFVPPTVRREIQFMKELEKHLTLNIEKIPVFKIKTEIAVPQKTLNKLEDRIENAKNTILIESISHYNNILIIDDAVGSGATINEVAAQIKNKKLSKGKIIGLAITGSFKGFDVISEV